MNNKKFNLIQMFKTDEALKYHNDLKHVFQETRIETTTQFESGFNKIQENVYSIYLKTSVKAREIETEKEEYEILVTYTGIFEIAGYSDDEVKDIVKTHAAMMLYPYCRSATSNIINESSYPNITLPVVNFFAIHEEQKKSETIQ